MSYIIIIFYNNIVLYLTRAKYDIYYGGGRRFDRIGDNIRVRAYYSGPMREVVQVI
jgi:hypothetical protein